jgi:hypothetical protein
MYYREDDRVSTLQIRGVTKDGNIPAPGSKLTYKFQKPIGIAYDHDSRGYAIIDTARELLGGPWYQHDCVINEATQHFGGFKNFDSVTLNTTIISTYLV